MRHHVAAATTIALVSVATLAAGASIQTSATVELVPPVTAALAAPVSADGATSWQIDTTASGPWQVSLEARDLDGRVLATHHPLPGISPSTAQDLTAFQADVPADGAAPMVMTLVLCRE